MDHNSFREILDSFKQGYPIEDTTFNRNLNLKDHEFKHDSIIKNCDFNEFVIFKNCQFHNEVCYINCNFNKGISFDNIIFANKVTFSNCKFIGESIFNDCKIFSIFFDNVESEDLLFTGSINNNSIKNESIEFKSTQITNLNLKDLELNKPLNFISSKIEKFGIQNGIINSSITFGNYEIDESGFLADDLYSESSIFNQRIDFINGKISKLLYVRKIEFNEQIVLKNQFFIESSNFSEVRAKRNVSYDYKENFNNLTFSDCWFDTSFSIHCFEKLEHYDNSVNITFDGIIHGNYLIEDLPATYISFSCINFGNIFFSRIYTKFIWLDNFHNYNKLFINNIKLNKDYNVLIIYNSNINNTEFENIDFRKFDEVVIAKSDVSSLVLSNSIFPKNILIKSKDPKIGVGLSEKDIINKNTYFRESYRQLKLAMDKAGNKYYALIYKSKELHYQRKELNWGWDKILLYFNYISNNNGLSWSRGIFFTLICAFIFFILLNYQLEQPYFYLYSGSSYDRTISTIQFGFEKYINYLASFPKLTIDGINTESWEVNIIILLSRIFISIGIYQTISAFRKYVK